MSRIIRLCLSATSALTLLFLIFPLLIVLGSSVSNSELLSFPPQGFTLKWYGVVFANSTYVNAFIVSTALAAASTLVAALLAIPASLAIARYEFIGKTTVETILMSSLVLPYIVLGAAFLQYGTSIGLVRSFGALLVGHVVIIMPFIMRSVIPQLSEDQRTLEEASRDLGAGAWVTFFLVTLPQIRSGVISGSVLAFITSWINVEVSIFQATPALTTIPVVLFNYVQYTIDPTIAAVSSVTILVAAALIVLLDLVFEIDIISKKK
ncbi:ABC transporter permease [Rhizobium sp. 18055]|jgi:putative spermidine/putrescine transport system permease protein|uniref:ABC transporter permease n=1 Tax=Rhizobium sp. 18055 TaxID=2681403 RepID=UPI00135942D5|nr:ABC transporter permease [Rhizobium sp. 18055]